MNKDRDIVERGWQDERLEETSGALSLALFGCLCTLFSQTASSDGAQEELNGSNWIVRWESE